MIIWVAILFKHLLYNESISFSATIEKQITQQQQMQAFLTQFDPEIFPNQYRITPANFSTWGLCITLVTGSVRSNGSGISTPSTFMVALPCV